MTLPTKGSRALEHHGESYRWLVGKRVLSFIEDGAGPMSAPCAHLELPVVIEHISSGSQLRARFHGLFALAVPSRGFDDVQDLRVTPAVVVKLIDHARAVHSWAPDAKPLKPLSLEDAQLICPEVVTLDRLELLELSFEPARLREYLRGATLVYER